jgi:NitT/TauT family transport system permease protein
VGLRRIAFYLPAIVVFAVTIAVWEVLVSNIQIRGFPLPAPSQIVEALGANWGAGRWPLQTSATATLIEAFGGLAIGHDRRRRRGAVDGAFRDGSRTACCPSRSAPARSRSSPSRPLMNNWFGVLNPLSKMMIVAVLVFFPVLVNVTRGIDPGGARRPGADAVVCRVGVDRPSPRPDPERLAILLHGPQGRDHPESDRRDRGEYFGGTSSVLGQVIVASAGALRFDVTWAAIILAAVTGIAMYLAIVAVERLVIPWHASMRGGGT